MTEPNNEVNQPGSPEYEPGDLEALYDIASEDFQNQMLGEIQGMIDDGMSDNEIVEALYDPAPRRRHRRRHKASTAAPKHRRRRAKTYYHAQTRKNGRGSAKVGNALGKIEPYVTPAVGIYQFYTLYNARATALGTNPSTGKPYTVIEALMYDLQNLPTTASGIPGRITANPTPLIMTLVGFFGKRMGLSTKVSKDKAVSSLINIGLGAVTGFGIAGLGKQILDPPITAGATALRTPIRPQAQITAAPVRFQAWG